MTEGSVTEGVSRIRPLRDRLMEHPSPQVRSAHQPVTHREPVPPACYISCSSSNYVEFAIIKHRSTSSNCTEFDTIEMVVAKILSVSPTAIPYFAGSEAVQLCLTGCARRSRACGNESHSTSIEAVPLRHPFPAGSLRSPAGYAS